MMNDLVQEQTKQALQSFSERHGPKVIVPATVMEVNNEDDTVKIEFSDGAIVDDCRLKSVVKAGDKFLLIPKVGSIVQVAKIENSDECLVIAVEEITEVKSVIGDTTFSLTDEGLYLKKQNDLLGKVVDDLLDAMINEKHLTPAGPTTGLLPTTLNKYLAIRIKLKNILRNA